VREAEVPLHARIASILVDAAQQSRQSPVHGQRLLDKSLRLAAPERMRRPFHEATPDLRRMMSRDAHLASLSTWLARGTATAEFGAESRHAAPDIGGPATAHGPACLDSTGLPPVIEPLTTKELEVLGHLAELLSTQEIASTMFISVNTVRTHVRNILRKLGVTRRSMAVRRAHQLGIV
jgi:LuxR family maltose regulon positive regulatory protein